MGQIMSILINGALIQPAPVEGCKSHQPSVGAYAQAYAEVVAMWLQRFLSRLSRAVRRRKIY